MTDYTSRLSIPLEGDPHFEFFSRSGELLATGYTRIVIGERGPYVEFSPLQLNPDVFDELNDADHYYYIELRSSADFVKAYLQIYRVDYADYVPGMCYISPFDMHDVDGKPLIKPLRR